MSQNGPHSLLHLLLAAAALGLAGLLIIILPGEPSTSAKTEAEPTAATHENLYVNFDIPEITLYAEMVERPLFSRNRRPIISTPPTTKPVTPQRSAPPRQTTFSLIGVVVSGGVKTALVRTNSDSELIRVNEQEYIDGWLAAEITPQSVVFISPSGANQTIDLKDNKTRARNSRKLNRRSPLAQQQIEQQRKQLKRMKQEFQEKSPVRATLKAQIKNVPNKTTR